MASDDQRPVDPRVSAYAKAMGKKPAAEKRAVPFNPPRISSSDAAKKKDAPLPPADLSGGEKPFRRFARLAEAVPARTPPADPAPAVKAQPQTGRGPSDASADVPSGGFLKVGGGVPSGENNYRKVAKFLVLVGKDEAARIIAKLDPAQVERVSRELSTITRIETAEAEALLVEFRSLLGGSSGALERGEGGVAAARDLLRAAFGKEKGDAYLRRAVPESVENPFAFIEDFEGEQILLLLKEESSAAISLVLARIEPKKAAAVIAGLAPELRLETVRRLAKMGKVAPEVIERTAAALREKARVIGHETARVIDGKAALAEILKRADASLGDRLLEELQDSDPELGRDIKDRLFTLDDIIKVEDRAVQDKLRTLSDKDIALLVKGRRPSFVEKILSNVTAARRSTIAEERAILGPVPRSEADAAAGEFLAYFRLGHEEGRIVMMDDADVVI